MTWRTDKPPGTGCFLADIGRPWAVVMVFNGADNDYVYASEMIDLYEGHWNNAYFENESAKPEEIKAWMPLPSLRCDP
ncbi:MAG: hypothetical protein R8M45_03150 [Ghiorsea sp.]